MTTKNSDTAVSSTQKTVSINRIFNLPVNTVWKAWTEEESFKKWWGPKNFTCPSCKIDLRVGGNFLACMKDSDDKEFWSNCTYREITPMKKLIYMDSFSDSKGNKVPASYYDMLGDWPTETKVMVTFEESDGKTKMTLNHESIPEEMYEDCTKGWQECFDKLEKNLK